MSSRAVTIVGADDRIPACVAGGILVGLPGGDVYLRREVELGLIAERRLHDLAVVRSIKLGEYIRDRDAKRYGLPRVTPDLETAKDELRRERARASGLEVPDRPDLLVTSGPVRAARAALRKLRKDPK